MHRFVLSAGFLVTTSIYTTTASSVLRDGPPADWVPLIETGNMAWSNATVVPTGLWPAVGNGFLGQIMSPLGQKTAPPDYGACGFLFLNGVHNGPCYDSSKTPSPSHAAALPSFFDLQLLPLGANGSISSSVAIDWSTATWYNRSYINAPGCVDSIVQLSAFAHRAYRDLLVFAVTAGPATAGGTVGSAAAAEENAWQGCKLPISWPLNISATAVDMQLRANTSSDGSAVIWSGSTLVPEEPGVPLFTLATAASAAAFTASQQGYLQFDAGNTQLTLLVTAASSAPWDCPPPCAPAQRAAAQHAVYAAYTYQLLRDSHVAAVAALHTSGIDVDGNLTVASLVNASLHDLVVASARGDVPVAVTPGVLGSNAYGKHAFWDETTWIDPVLTLFAAYDQLYPAFVQYRVDRLPAALQRAAARGYEGAMWPWQSAVTGQSCDRSLDDGNYEQHIGADLLLATQKWYYITGNTSWLSSVWAPLLNTTCSFFACRFTRTDTPINATAGPGTNCSAHTGVGNWTLRYIVGPDESAGVVSDDAYSNAAGAAALGWCVEAAGLLGLSHTVPPAWSQIAAAPYLPLNDTLYAGGTVHNEYTGYPPGRIIQQTDVQLLQYPLGLPMPADVARRDLDFWTSVTDLSGMFTGDTAIAIAYLGLNASEEAAAQWSSVWGHIDTANFYVSKETVAGGSHHFITGQGSILQIFTHGYSGLRVQRPGVLSFTSPQPSLPPYSVTRLALRGMHLHGVPFDFAWTADTICVALQSGAPAPAGVQLQLRLVRAGTVQPITASQLCVPVQPVEVEVVGSRAR